MSMDAVRAAVVDVGVVAVIREHATASALAVARSAIAGGIRAIEVTCTTPDAPSVIRTLCNETAAMTVSIGAGSVFSIDDADRVIDAGATFVVSPTLTLDVLSHAKQRQTAAIPGGFTPTELITASLAGAPIVKLFPAGVLGPAFLRDLRATRPRLDVMPTGGIALDGVTGWIRAGAVAIGVGSALRGASDAETTTNAQRWCAAVRRAREIIA
jgi:2-dehydro-3-deoxyphosphogluconate aldolase / (4S)-4-hydroxy-2-oxoglutarate aldolase